MTIPDRAGGEVDSSEEASFSHSVAQIIRILVSSLGL